MREQKFVIAPVHSLAHYRTCEELQQSIWRSDALDVVPAHVLITAQRHGGLVLGAFDAADRMIGFLFGFPGRVAADNPATLGPQWQHCSHIMGVVPEWRGRGVGYGLKLAQREWALSQGYELVTWTYNPLEAANGVLNLGKLGAICRCYLRDFYGELTDGLSRGIPTDRFEVGWWVGSKRVRRRLESGWVKPSLEKLLGASAVILNPGLAGSDGWTEPGPVHSPEGEQLLVEIPARFQVIKAASLALARSWQLNVRQACEVAFESGYTACDVVREDVHGVPRVYYLLKRSL